MSAESAAFRLIFHLKTNVLLRRLFRDVKRKTYDSRVWNVSLPMSSLIIRRGLSRRAVTPLSLFQWKQTLHKREINSVELLQSKAFLSVAFQPFQPFWITSRRDHSMLVNEEVTQRAGNYEDAITALNSLQSNAHVIQKAAKERSLNAYKNPINCLRNLKIIGVEADDLNKLNVVHVSGTKGKGSTCALVESILRSYGFKTGLYTSPHIIEVRERIKINGQPLSREEFTSHFWPVFEKLRNDEVVKNEMPPYFSFLTVMALNVFVKEKVDVAVLEVGIGGRYDCTNVIPKPVVVGVTSLGFDHTNILGVTIESIAENKAGIFREGIPAFTIDQQYNAGLDTLLKCSQEVKCPLFMCPPLSLYTTENDLPVVIGIDGKAQTSNASLALQLCNHWLKVTNNCNVSKNFQNCRQLLHADPFMITTQQLNGLQKCKWPGRCQVLSKNNIHYFLDGAHTVESIDHCVSWFKVASRKLSSNKNIPKILIFNCIGQRDVRSLLRPLRDIRFDYALFSTNNVDTVQAAGSDSTDFNVDFATQLKMVEHNFDEWRVMQQPNGKLLNALTFTCISHAINWIKKIENTEVHVLVTGSLRLVGGVLSIVNND